MKITKITLYNVPFRYSTQDRIIENVDTKIERWKKDTIVATIDTDGNALFDTVAYDITNGFEGSITINSTNRYNYARLETDLYGTKPVYVFLHALKSIESSTGFSYNIKIDVMASFGKELFDKMNGKNVLIDRMHEDRYKVEGANAIINLDNHALLNSDFKVPDTRGMKVIYDGSSMSYGKDTVSSDTNYEYDPAFFNFDSKLSQTEKDRFTFGPYNDGVVRVNNTVKIGNKKYWAYAFITRKGFPDMSEPVTSGGSGPKSDMVIAPITLSSNIEDTKVNGTRAHFNDMIVLEKLQKDKVINYYLLPYKLHIEPQNWKTGSGTNVHYYRGSNYGYEDCKFMRYKANTTDVDPSATITDAEIKAGKFDLCLCTFEAGLGINKIISSVLDVERVVLPYQLNKIANDLVMDNFYKKLTKAQLTQIVGGDYSSLVKIETQLMNQQISPISIIDGSSEHVIDIYNLLKDEDYNKKQLVYDFVATEEGYKSNLKVSKTQFVSIEGSDMLSFLTESGSSYLATNSGYLNAQKRAIEEQTKLQKIQGKAGQAGVYGGGLLGGLMSAINPANWVQSNYLRQANEQMDNVSEAEKAKVDAHVQDMSATAPTLRTGDYKSLSVMINNELDYSLNFTMKIPNDFLLKKIYYYVQKHGYKIDDWTNFNEDIYNSRVEWNMLTIKQALDYIPQTDYDDSIITEFAARLENGVRIWHKDDFTIDYTKINLEKKLKTWLDS